MKKHRYHPIRGWHVFLMFLGAVAAIQSWKWSFDILSSLFGMGTGALLATMVTVVEIYFLMQFILTWHGSWLIGVIPGFIISIAGSYGNFQMNYEQNVEKSATYQRKENEIAQLEKDRDAALNAAQGYDETKQPWYSKKARQRADQLQTRIDAGSSELENMTNQGYGSKNALFRSISRHADISTLDSAERSHLMLGLFVELFMLACTVIGTHAKKAGYTWVRGNENEYNVSWDEDGNVIYTKATPKEKKPDTPKDSPPRPQPRPEPKPPQPVNAQGQGGNGVRPSPPSPSKPKPEVNQNSFKIDPGFRSERAKSKIDLTAAKKRAKEKRIKKLQEFISENPGAKMEDKMKAIGVNSANTIRNYEREIERRF